MVIKTFSKPSIVTTEKYLENVTDAEGITIAVEKTRNIYTPVVETRALTDAEITQFAGIGDTECKKYLLMKDVDLAATVTDIKVALQKWLS